MKPHKKATKGKKSLQRNWSAKLVDAPERAQSRAMLHAVGFERGDFQKSQIGVASTWSQVTPCNIHIDKLAVAAAEGVAKAGSKPLIFNTITISDGISMGTQGMKYSLVSREVIADSIETVMGCEMFDGLVAIGGCDKNMPACVMALARLNRPSIFVYGGTILPGCITGVLAAKRLRKDQAERIAERKLDVRELLRSRRARFAAGITMIDEKELETHRGKCAIPGRRFSCGGMYTANTMASAIEATRHVACPNSALRKTPSLTAPKRRTPAAPACRCASPAGQERDPTPRTSSPSRPSKTPSPWSSRSAARPMPCSISSPWPIRPM